MKTEKEKIPHKEDQINFILKHFNWGKVHKTMKSLEWKWFHVEKNERYIEIS